MANPNIVDVTEIYGKYALRNCTINTDHVLINNPAGSGKVFKINSITASNTSTTTAGNIFVRVHPQDDGGGTATQLIPQVSVPFRATLVCVDKTSGIYLTEDSSIVVRSDVGTMHVVASWEEIS